MGWQAAMARTLAVIASGATQSRAVYALSIEIASSR
jgi:hypothetical protein